MRRNKLLPILIFLCIASVALMIHTLTARPAFTPPPFDSTAQTGIPADIPGYEQLDVPAFQVGFLSRPYTEGNQLLVYFSNSPENTCYLRLRILDADGNMLGQSGLIRPGEFLQSVTLDILPATDPAIILKVMAYEPETYHSAGAVTFHTTLQIP